MDPLDRLNELLRQSNETYENTTFGMARCGNGHALKLSLSGSLDTESSSVVPKLICEAMDSYPGANTVLIDLAELGYISSTGVGALVSSFVEAKKRSRRFVLVNMTSQIARIIELLGFLSFFERANESEFI